jgi:hypothetical protein
MFFPGEDDGMFHARMRCGALAIIAVTCCWGTESDLRGEATGSRLASLSVSDGLAMKNRRSPLQVLEFTPDDGDDDSDAFSDACRQACLRRQPLWLASGTYDIDKNTTVICTDDLFLVGMGDVHMNLDGFLTFQANVADDLIRLREDVCRKDRTIVVDDTGRCSAGDLVCIDTAVIAESGWKTPKREVHRIEEIPDATTLRFEEPLVFSYGTADQGLTLRAYKRRRLTIVNVAFDVNDHQLTTQYFSGGTVLRGCRWTERDKGEQDGYLYSPGWSIGVTVSDAVFEGGYYGCIPACSREVTFESIRGYRCAGHVVAPNNWCYGVHVENISGSECGSLVDSHPSLEVHYSNVSGQITSLPNLRSLGGSIRHYHVESTLRTPKPLYFQNLDLLANTEIYDEANLVLENFSLATPNMASDSNASADVAVVRYGYQAILKDVNWGKFSFYPGPLWRGPRNGFHEIQVSDCNVSSLSFWGGQRATIENCHFVNTMDGAVQTAIGVRSGSSCSVVNSTFTDYVCALAVSSGEFSTFDGCLFSNCDAVFLASDMPPRVRFEACEFRGGGWGEVDTCEVQVLNCIAAPAMDVSSPPER